MHYRITLLLAFTLASLLLSAQAVQRAPLLNTGAIWTVDTENFFHVRLTGQQRYLGSPESAAITFLQTYASALANPTDLKLERANRAENGRNYLRFNQHKDGVPVLGRGVTVEITDDGAIMGVSGTLLSDTSFVPALLRPDDQSGNTPAATSFSTAVLRATYPHFDQWNTVSRGQTWTNHRPWEQEGTWQLTDVVDVFEPGGHRSERVYLANNKVVFHHQLHCDLNREQYHDNTNAANLVWSEGDAFPGTLNADDQEILRSTEETYYLFYRTFGRNSYDDADGLMRGVSSANLSNCPNATATGTTVRHCDGVVGDDVIAHEWSHNYTGRMNGLIYAYESGALNEAYADIFGESVDLLNSRGDDTSESTLRTDCDNTSVRWLLGEDTDFGALRDMWSPECKSDPSDRASSEYHCAESDNGGVHINSGLINRLYSLLVDGGTQNGITVSAIGMTKALHIFFHAADNYVGPTTGFAEFAPMLKQSTTDLMGINLTSLTLLAAIPPASGEIITAADLQEVQDAINAVQLETTSPCPSDPTLAQNPPASCAVTDNFIVLLSEDWESGTGTWSLTEEPVNPATWDAKPWALNSSLPDGRSGQGLFAPNPRIGDCQADLDNGSVHLSSPVISLPADVNGYELRFNHYYSTENNYDGGVMYLSINGGAYTYLPNSAFVYNGYDDALVGPSGNDNPVAGFEVFNGSDNNSTSGTWGTTVVDLTAAGVQAGDDVQIRWSMTHDGCNGWLGWYLDEVEVGYCESFILPVTYSSLAAHAKKDHILVNWSTANEEANTGFFVERKADGESNFTTLGFIAAGANYDFADYRVRSHKTYVYRLRQTDLDGTENLSPLVSATMGGDRLLTAFPNPARGSINLTGSGKRVEIFDLNGRIVREVILNEGTGIVRGLDAGVYLVRTGREVLRIMVY